MATPLINGYSYSGAQIRLNVLGREIIGIIGVKYSDTQEMKDNYGQGFFPTSRGLGRIKADASITLEMVEVEALQQAAPFGRLQSIPEFDITVSFVDDYTGILTFHIIKNCRFMSNSRDVKTSDTSVEVELPLICSHIKWK